MRPRGARGVRGGELLCCLPSTAIHPSIRSHLRLSNLSPPSFLPSSPPRNVRSIALSARGDCAKMHSSSPACLRGHDPSSEKGLLHSARRNNADALERKKGGTRKRSDRWRRGQKTARKWGGREGKGKAARGRISGGRKDYGSGDRCLVATTQYHRYCSGINMCLFA